MITYANKTKEFIEKLLELINKCIKFTANKINNIGWDKSRFTVACVENNIANK